MPKQMNIQFHTCDVFTDTPFGGNQLAVIPDAVGIPDEALQNIAKEFNFSETIFVYPPVLPKHTKRVRIFTPGGELPFAGHPTIGAAITLGSIGAIPLTGDRTTIVLEETIGPVPVSIHSKEGIPVFAELTTATLPSFQDDVPPPDRLAAMLHLTRREINDADYKIRFASVGFPFLLVPVKNRTSLMNIRVDTVVMEQLKLGEVFVFTDETGSPDVQFRARMFAPLLGISEDPATGSACAAFAGYLADNDRTDDGTLRWCVDQGIEMGRPSRLYIEADKRNSAITAVRVGGSAVMMTEGTMTL